MARLSAKAARAGAIPPGKSDHVIWDGALIGFGLRIRKGAKHVRKQWVLQYLDAERKSRRFIIGTVDELSAAEARDVAAEKLAGVRLGIYPHAQREKQRREAERSSRDNTAPNKSSSGKNL
jgi:Arm domain-containing DNA-binding protein